MYKQYKYLILRNINKRLKFQHKAGIKIILTDFKSVLPYIVKRVI